MTADQEIRTRFNLPTTMNFGSWVKDKFTGFEGTIVNFTSHLSGNVRAGIVPQAKSEDKSYPDGADIDVSSLEFLRATDATCLPLQDTPVQLGDLVEDIVTGYRGIVLYAHLSASGCINFAVQAKLTKKQQSRGLPDGGLILIPCLKLVIVQDDPLGLRPSKEQTPAAEKAPGGPVTKFSQRPKVR